MARSCPGRDPSGACTWRSSRRHSTGQFPKASQTPTLLPGRACAYPPIFKIPHIKPAMPGGFHAAEPLRTRVRLNWGRWVYDRACVCGLAKPYPTNMSYPKGGPEKGVCGGVCLLTRPISGDGRGRGACRSVLCMRKPGGGVRMGICLRVLRSVGSDSARESTGGYSLPLLGR
jgi:hypothetical protein